MAEVTIRDLRKAYGAQEVIHGVDLDITDGQFVVLVGPSGCLFFPRGGEGWVWSREGSAGARPLPAALQKNWRRFGTRNAKRTPSPRCPALTTWS